MLRRPSDLQLDRDPSGRFLPFAVTLMVFLAMLATAAALALSQSALGFQHGLEGRLTVQIADEPGSSLAPRSGRAAELLRQTPGIARAEEMPREAVAALLQPWLGRDGLTRELPLPALIDIELTPGMAVDLDALQAHLADAVPGARIDDPRPWLDRLSRIAVLLEGLALAIVAAIGLATVAMVVFATRAGLAAHRDVIEVLHLIGARDAYIARQFQAHALRLALRGALAGTALAALALFAIGRAAAQLDAALLPPVEFGPLSWATLVALPLVASLLATVTARLTVLGALRRMT
ncbi:MAG: cell division protein [Alphaproteobacteria bacterium]|jgi:cell division transport system permease protein|nr:cell division protein [Alphaproteobacteria bacterium]